MINSTDYLPTVSDPNNNWGTDSFPWAQGNIGSLPFSNVWAFPGDTVLSLLNRYVDNLAKPGFLGSLNLVQQFIFNVLGPLSSNGTLGQHGLAEILSKAGMPGGNSLAQELAIIMGLQAYKTQGSVSQADINSWIAQFSGNDQFSQELKSAFASLAGVDWGKYDSQSVALEWGNWVQNGGLEGIVPSFRKLSLKLLEENNTGVASTNILYLYVLFYCIEASADREDGMVSQGVNMDYISQQSTATQKLANAAEDKATSGKEFFSNLDEYLTDLQGSPLGTPYYSSVAADAEAFKNLTFTTGGKTYKMWDYYQTNKDKPGTNWTDFNNAWKDYTTVTPPDGSKDPSGNKTPSEYSKLQSSIAAMVSLWQDTSQVQTTEMQTLNSKDTNLRNTITEIINSLIKQFSQSVQAQKQTS